MTLTSMRRLPMRMIDPQSHQDENTMPSSSCSTQATVAAAAPCPSGVGKSGLVRSPSKLPTLSDIAARLNRDGEASTPGNSPMKQIPGNGSDAARPRLELTGRITGSPKPPQQGDRKSPLLPASPSKPNEVQSLQCLSPKGPSSGACSPTKRMLAKGLPSLEEIRDRMSRKGLAVSNDETSPKLNSTPSSPNKPASEALTKTPEILQPAERAPAPAPPAKSPMAEDKKPMINKNSTANKPALKLTTSSTVVPKLNHPLPPTPAKAPSYPLQHEWSLFFDTRSAGPSTPGFAPESAASHAPPTPTLTTSSWEANLRTIGSYSTVNTFLGCFSKLHRPSQLDRHSSYHVFKDGIKPMWEDPRNADGGKWTITFRQRNPALVDRSWLWLVLGLIGEEMDGEDETCGAVCSVKPRGDRISLWVRDRSNVETVNKIGKKLLSLLELEKESGIALEFSSHSDKADEKKQEGLFSIANPIQQMARTPTISSFGPATGLPSAEGVKHAAAAAAGSPSMLMATSPTSPGGKSFSRSPITAASPNSEPYARLGGQSNPNMFGRSPGNASPSNFGSLGQSLGLGIGVNTSPSVSPNPNLRRDNAKNPFQQGLGEGTGGALSWRSTRSTSPQRTLTTVSNNRNDLLKMGASTVDRSRSVSPFKAD
ncbi:related to CDC33 - translation initiation factor eIF4E [Ustilago trichophora]|uniref:Related to CDC33 - translation initiation factor eIF4E n=1 Tax=Ustilago trichophora TaxID=86804 RepID=A0A5C3E249_9BASI|nr:related to CDC33 - translation initiation factor eIF4E [Ustilago trichophora]